jgi:GT2 family glycosyltransferase
MTPQIAVIIVNYNAGPRLARCLECLESQTFRGFEVIVIDNASTDASLEAARASSLRPRIIEAGANLGFAAANNRAAATTQAEWLAFLNPDAYAAPDWLERLLEGAMRYAFADAFGSTQTDAQSAARLDGVGDVFSIFGIAYRGGFGWPIEAAPEDGECFSPCAAAAMYRRKTFEALGGFDETFFCYGEDVDLGFRMRLAGGRAVQLKEARVAHEGSAVSGRRSDFTVYHGNRNRIWLTYKNLPGLFYWPSAPLRHFADLYLLARAFMVGTGPAYVRALKDGYGRLHEIAARRKAVQGERRVALGELARMIDWLPFTVFRRAPSLRPITRA